MIIKYMLKEDANYIILIQQILPNWIYMFIQCRSMPFFIYSKFSWFSKMFKSWKIENNEVIEAFIKEYYQESNLYYCKYKPASINWKIEPKICDAKIKIKFPVIFILLICYFGVRCIIQIYNYFRLIRPNIDHYEYLHID